jgi:hypothetical protein
MAHTPVSTGLDSNRHAVIPRMYSGPCSACVTTKAQLAHVAQHHVQKACLALQEKVSGSSAGPLRPADLQVLLALAPYAQPAQRHAIAQQLLTQALDVCSANSHPRSYRQYSR